MKIGDAVKYVNENAKKRNFKEGFEVIINLKGINLKQVEHRFSEEVFLPNKLTKPRRVMVIGNEIGSKAKDVADIVVSTKDLEDKKAFKKKVKDVHYLIAEAPLMVKIGKEFGKILGSRGKMPKPLPPQADPKPLVERLKNTIVVRLKDIPQIQCIIGYEDMDEKSIVENYMAIYSAVVKHLPAGIQNIKSIYIKRTMGHPVRIDVKA